MNFMGENKTLRGLILSGSDLVNKGMLWDIFLPIKYGIYGWKQNLEDKDGTVVFLVWGDNSNFSELKF